MEHQEAYLYTDSAQGVEQAPTGLSRPATLVSGAEEEDLEGRLSSVRELRRMRHRGERWLATEAGRELPLQHLHQFGRDPEGKEHQEQYQPYDGRADEEVEPYRG